MGFEIIVSSRIEDFLDQFSSQLNPSLFQDNKLFLIQNEHLRRWFSLNMADRQGVSLAGSLAFPDQALKKISQGLGMDKGAKLLYLDDLKLVLFEEIRKLLSLDSVPQETEPLVKYLKTESKDPGVKIFNFAQELAGLFHNYSMNGPEIWFPWQKAGESLRFASWGEGWQKYLWNKVFDRKRFSHLGIEIHHLIDEEREYEGPLEELIILGSLFLSPMALDLLYLFSQKSQVRYFLYYPFKGEDPRSFSPPGPMEDWHKLMEGFLSWTEGKNIQWQVLKGKSTQVLHYLLSPIEEGKEELPKGEIEFHLCSTPLREVEVLRDRLWNYLAQNPEVSLRDIGILAPDIRPYGPYFQKVFQGQGERPLPYNLVDMDFGQQSSYIQGFLGLLDLVGSRWSRKQVLELLENPNLAQGLGYTAEDWRLWRDFSQQVHVYWGWDQEHLSQLGYLLEEGITWKEGFRRFWEGTIRAPREKNWFDFPRDWKRIPLGGVGTGTTALLARFMQILQGLFDHLENQGEKTLEQWGDWSKSLIQMALGIRPEVEEDRLSHLDLEGAFHELFQISKDLSAHYSLEKITFPVFYQVLKDKFRRLQSSRGSFQVEGVSCCSIGPFRAMPFKVIALLGMKEGAFPKSPKGLSINLMEQVEGTWMDNTATDLYSLLESLGSARHKWWVFYKGRNPQTEEVLDPAMPIQNLNAFLKSSAREEKTSVFLHPLVSHDPQGYGKEAEGSFLPTSAKARDLGLIILEKRQGGRVLSPLTTVPALEPPLPGPLDFEHWLLFFSKPHRFFLRKVLSLYPQGVGQEEEDELPGELPPWVLREIQEAFLQLQKKDVDPRSPLRWLKEEGALVTPLDQEFWEDYLTRSWKTSSDFHDFHPGQMIRLRLGEEEDCLEKKIWKPGWFFWGQSEEIWEKDHQLFFFQFKSGEGGLKEKLSLRDIWPTFWKFLTLFVHGEKRFLSLVLWKGSQIQVLPWNPPSPALGERIFYWALEAYEMALSRPLGLLPEILEKMNFKSGEGFQKSWKEVMSQSPGQWDYFTQDPAFALLESQWSMDEGLIAQLEEYMPVILSSFPGALE